eukprot:TRINITY_DN13506_c0_g1_i1.p1 TRINITY_DN13506_c0_g1~~TRINITY_DN13506_c0_g1_i1.p1  ORF type:complete len:352 (+),score=76.35 TRINITY_DN13506_c0_g1_i1:46-1101(+)
MSVLSTMLTAALALNASYESHVENRVTPMVSKALNTSTYFLNCNPAYTKLPSGQGALIVRVQNCTREHDACPDEHWQTLGPSHLVILKETSPNVFEYADDSKITFGPDNVGPAAAYGTEDPRIVYREKTGVYYLTFTAASQPGVKVSYFATTTDPTNPDLWHVHNKIDGAPGGAAILIRDDTHHLYPTHYLFATDDGLAGSLEIGTSRDLLHWTMTGRHLLVGRPGMWDEAGVAAGPSPERLEDGNYVFFYPTDHHGQDPKYGRCALGWAILDKDDPTIVVDRCDAPLMVAETTYEKVGFTPNVIFTTGCHRIQGTMNEFMLYYGAADTVVAGAHIIVTRLSEGKYAARRV